MSYTGATVTVTGVLDGHGCLELSHCQNVLCVRPPPVNGDWIQAGELVGQLYDSCASDFRMSANGVISDWFKWRHLRYPTKEVIDAEKSKVLHKYTSDELFAAAIVVREKEQKKTEEETSSEAE